MSRRSIRIEIATVLACLPALWLAMPAPASALIHPATVLDGPASGILELDGTAMAADGSGGLVYRKEVEGVAHVFAVQFENGHWGAPVQVDTADPYGASQPAIGAGDGGRLLVVWVQPHNVSPEGVTEYELMGASLEPGASAFGRAIVIDPNVGEPYSGNASSVDPRLAMAADGVAYVLYRVVTLECNPLRDPTGASQFGLCPPGNSGGELVDVRVARYDYLFWSSLGAVNRAPQLAMRAPTSTNVPSIGIDDLAGNNGVVAWQEPDSDGVARIWVRRLFGDVIGNVLQASPEAIGGRAVNSDADSPTVAESPYGEARIAYRIQGAPGSAVASTGLFLDLLPSAVDFHSGQLGPPTEVSAGSGAIGAPSAAVEKKGDFRIAWTQGTGVQELTGEEEGSLGFPTFLGSTTGQALATINPAGGGITSWPSAGPGGVSTVAVREDYAQGASQSAQLAGDVAGAVGGLSLGGDGQGDALLGWTQGPPGLSEVVGAFVQAPPAPFQVSVPIGWVRPSEATIEWLEAPDAVAGVTYTVYLDGRPRLRGLTGLRVRLNHLGLGDGVHRVQVLATDASGQQTMSPTAHLKIDANPPAVRLRLIDRGRGVRVTVRDEASGVDAGATRISFGDGTHVRRRTNATHVYRRAGTYRVQVQVRSRAGNQMSITLKVRVG
jgi:hypothetical protein